MAVKIQGVALDVEPVNVGHQFLNVLDPRVTEFQDVLAVQTNEMIMLPVPVRRLVLGLCVSKLVTNDEVAIQ